MSDEKMIRIDNLKLLMRLNSWSHADLARRVRKSDSYISQLLAGKKNFGEKSARSIEERCGKPRYWLDTVHDELDYTSVGNPSENVGTNNSSQSNQPESLALPPQVTHDEDGRADSKVKCNTLGFNESRWSAAGC